MNTVILACLIARFGIAAGSIDAPRNLVANPSFEQPGKANVVPDGWNGDSHVYSTDAAVSHRCGVSRQVPTTGGASL